MDRMNHDSYVRTTQFSSTGPNKGTVVTANPTAHSPRLQKKPSKRKVNEHALNGVGGATPRASLVAQESGYKGRKGSIRNAVRRIFGRRSSKGDEQRLTVASSPSAHHGYHRSEPTGFLTVPADLSEHRSEEERADAERCSSVPTINRPSPPFVGRTRSPYAVEFPHSARLKPLNLGSPFDAPGSQLRRRRTLPSIPATESDAKAIQASLHSAEAASIAPPIPSLVTSETSAPNAAMAAKFSRTEKRRSRSAQDLRTSFAQHPSSPQGMQFWRESFQGGVLRASGFRAPPRNPSPARRELDEDLTSLAQRTEDPFDAGLNKGETSLQDARSPQGIELSQDLEDRVARLEMGLRSFQGALERLTAERSRAVSGASASEQPYGLRPRTSSGGPGRTASMLAETLRGNVEPSTYRYDYRDTVIRPVISSATPHTPIHTPPAQRPRRDYDEPHRQDDPFTTTRPAPHPPLPRLTTDNPPAVSTASGASQYTFRSLYEMLADERSARRRLESTLRGLQDDIANLHYQVSITGAGSSHFASQRSSDYRATMHSVGGLRDSMAGSSSKLQALLHDIESSPGSLHSQSQRQQDPDPSRNSGSSPIYIDPRVVSRFSGSESEAARSELDEVETPHELYRTPIEDSSRFPFGAAGMGREQGIVVGGGRLSNVDMF